MIPIVIDCTSESYQGTPHHFETRIQLPLREVQPSSNRERNVKLERVCYTLFAGGGPFR